MSVKNAQPDCLQAPATDSEQTTHIVLFLSNLQPCLTHPDTRATHTIGHSHNLYAMHVAEQEVSKQKESTCNVPTSGYS